LSSSIITQELFFSAQFNSTQTSQYLHINNIIKLLLHTKNSAVHYKGLFVAFLLREAKALGQEKRKRREEERRWRGVISYAAVLGGMRKMVFGGVAHCTVSSRRWLLYVPAGDSVS
jgi:hypothetical protein